MNNLDLIDNFGKKIDYMKIERTEQLLAFKYVRQNDTVLELGARFGSVSCTVNKILNKKHNHVVVEPCCLVQEALSRNKIKNDCSFHIINGFISNKNLGLINQNKGKGYGTTFIDDNSSNIKIYNLKDIERKYDIRFNVLIADCEGFLERFFDENPDFYKQLRLIIFEADYPEKCDYDKIRNMLIKYKFKKIIHGHQNVYMK